MIDQSSTGPTSPPPSVASTPTAAHHMIRPVAFTLTRARDAKKNSAAPVGKRTQATYPIQKPMKSKYVRVHPSADYRQPMIRTYTDSDTDEMYYVSPELELPESVAAYTKITDLYAAQMHDGTVFIWFVHHSDTSWFRAANRAIKTCMSLWRRVISRKAANTYDLYAPEQPIPEPIWEDLLPFLDMVEIAFEDRLITSIDHPVIRKLRGFADDDE